MTQGKEQQGRDFALIVSTDPLADMPLETRLHFEPVWVGQSNAENRPLFVNNWNFFEGTILAIIIRTQGKTDVLGTAVIVAPGLAITAKHIYEEHLNEIQAGTVGIACMGISTLGGEYWLVRKICGSIDSDIAYLSIELASKISPNWSFRNVPLTTRTPLPGEKISIFGFQVPSVVHQELSEVKFTGNLYAAKGKVLNVYHPMRDKTMMPHPTLEIDCGAIGGMSGGAVLDARGFLLGIISTSLETSDQKGPTYASWIIGAMNRQLEIPWPKGMYSQPVDIIDIPEGPIIIEGRDKIRIIDANNYQFEVWHRPPEI